MLNEGYSQNIYYNSEPDLYENETIQNLVSSVYDYYDNFLFNRSGYYTDEDTSYEIWIDVEKEDDVLYCYKIRIDFEFLDEMNEVVAQSIYVDFQTGNVTIMDDDYGCICNTNENDFNHTA